MFYPAAWNLSERNIIVSERLEVYNLKLVSVFSKTGISNEAQGKILSLFVSIFTCFFGAVPYFLRTVTSPFLMLKSKSGLEE